METRPKKLLDQVRDAIRLKHYSCRTEQSYVGWVRRYILFHHKRHPREMGVAEVEAFLTHLAVEGRAAASTLTGRSPNMAGQVSRFSTPSAPFTGPAAKIAQRFSRFTGPAE